MRGLGKRVSGKHYPRMCFMYITCMATISTDLNKLLLHIRIADESWYSHQLLCSGLEGFA